MFFYDPTFIIIIPALILTIYAEVMVKRAFSKYSKININSGLSGKEIAQKILNMSGLNIPIERTPGNLTDHYDPLSKILRLSPEVYDGKSIASAGIAAHEVGHALQHASKYAPLILRTSSYPIARFASFGGPILLILGLLLSLKPFLLYGIIIYSVSVLFYLITLPVEFNASSRAKSILVNNGFISGEEKDGVDKVLNAAALTYVASALVAVLQLIRLILIFRNRD